MGVKNPSFYIYLGRLDDINVQACACVSLHRSLLLGLQNFNFCCFRIMA